MLGIFTQYKIIVCPHCGLIQFVRDDQRSRKCPNSKCRKRINLEQIIVLKRTCDIQKAVKIVQDLKERGFVLQKMEDIHPILEEDD